MVKKWFARIVNILCILFIIMFLLFVPILPIGPIGPLLGWYIPAKINQFKYANGPFVLMGLEKTAVLGHTFEEINEKYNLAEEYTEYDENGEVKGAYYLPTDECASWQLDGWLDIENQYVYVTFENKVAIGMEAVALGYDGFKNVNKAFDDWFTSYPYLGFIY